jgi:biotin carboxylase
MKTLLVISGGYEAMPGIQRAKEMGLYVVVSDIDVNAPGFVLADDRFLVSTYDIEASVKAAKEYHKTIRPIDGVICIAVDVPLTVAHIAQELGLSGVSIETARLTSDKLAMKQCFKKKGIPIPWFCQVESVAHLRSIVSEHSCVVLKPVDSRGARGVLKLTESTDLNWAYKYSISFSPSARIMVEEYLKGPQISTESIIFDGKGVTPGFTDRNYEFLDHFAPYIIENGGHQPSILKVEEQRAVSRLAEKAALALGITTGVAKGDMVLTKDGPKVIEIAARLSGGWLSTDQIPLATGVDFIGSAIRLALGENIEKKDLIPKYQKGVAIRYFFANPGKVIKIENLELFKNKPWIYKLKLFIKSGDSVEPVTNHTKRIGFVITTAENRQQAIKKATEVVNSIKIETQP